MPLYKVVSACPPQPDYFGLSSHLTPKSLLDDIDLVITRTQECIHCPSFNSFLTFHNKLIRDNDRKKHSIKKISGARESILSEMHLNVDFFSQLQIKLKEFEQNLLNFHSTLTEETQRIEFGIRKYIKSIISDQNEQAKILKTELIAKKIEHIPFHVMQERLQIADEYLQTSVQMQTDYIYSSHGIVSQVRSQQAIYDVVIMLYAYIGYFHRSSKVYLTFTSKDPTRTTAYLFSSLKSRFHPKFSACFSSDSHRNTFIKILDEAASKVLTTQAARAVPGSKPYDSISDDLNEYIKCVVERSRQLMKIYSINEEFVERLQFAKIDLSFDESKIAQDALDIATQTALQAAQVAIASHQMVMTRASGLPQPKGILRPQRTQAAESYTTSEPTQLARGGSGASVSFALDLPPLELPTQIPPDFTQIERMNAQTRTHESRVEQAHRSIDRHRKKMHDLRTWLHHAPWDKFFTAQTLERDVRILTTQLNNWFPEHHFGQRAGSSPLVNTLRNYEDRWNRQISSQTGEQHHGIKVDAIADLTEQGARFSDKIDLLQNVSLVLFNILHHLKKSQAFTITGEELTLHL